MSEKRKILIADDEPVTREVLGKMLTNAGYEVIFAEDGKSAVQKAGTEKPDLVLMDGLMPKMHGFLACKAIKALADPPSVIVLTGVYTKPTYKWEAQGEFGADGLLTKPVDVEVLLRTVEKQLSGGPSVDRLSGGFDISGDAQVSTASGQVPGHSARVM